MTNTQHTPGPWLAASEDIVREQSPSRENGGFVICQTFGDGKQANARLIAAAPDLLAALEEFSRECDGYLDGDGHPWPPLLRARAAIAKARGQ